MYGMIHRGIRFMVEQELGANVWDEICSKHAIGPEHLISAHTYDDGVTIGILEGAADRFGLELSDLLQTFGRHWIKFAERGSYGAMMDFTGKDIATFVANLDRMHHAVVVAMPNARVPSFRLAEQSDTELIIEYRSERTGLEPFVVGLLEGLLIRFGHCGSVACLSNASITAIFKVTIRADD